jgi:pilus assembly protein CpaD
MPRLNQMQTASRRARVSRSAPIIAALAAALALSACNTTKRVVAANDPQDYRKVHPIVLVEGQRTLDVFIVGGKAGIGQRQVADLQDFSLEHRRNGLGPIAIAVPDGQPGARQAAAAVRHALAKAGSRVMMTSYTPLGFGSPAPLKLSFPKIKADVATQCGRWPSDLAGNDGSLATFQNKPFENFGCSTQQYLAAQVADPLDLQRSRPLSAPNGERMTNVVTLYSAGKATQSETAEQAQTVTQAVGQ